MALTEDQVLKILQGELPRAYRKPNNSGVEVGIGDDAAVLSFGKNQLVWTMDACEEGAHFASEWMTPEDVAHKSFHAALSDIPAMGAVPRAALCQLTVGRGLTKAWLERFSAQQAQSARALGVPILGGNISFGQSTRVVMSFLGEVQSGAALLRSGAKPGDDVWLVGDIGLSRAGLLFLERRATRAQGEGARARCLHAFRRPMAQLAAGKVLGGCAHACMDVSDGLARDAGQIGLASGVRLILVEEKLRSILCPELLEAAARLGEDPLELALQGGEDYALLATGPRAKRPRIARVIGRVEQAKRTEARGAWLEGARGLDRVKGGFVHGHSRGRNKGRSAT